MNPTQSASSATQTIRVVRVASDRIATLQQQVDMLTRVIESMEQRAKDIRVQRDRLAWWPWIALTTVCEAATIHFYVLNS